MRVCLAAVLPLALGAAVLAAPIATVVFGWGAATGDTAPLGLTLAAFAPGLVLFTVHYAVLRGFYAIEDTRTPFLIQCVIAAVNIGLAVALTALATPYNYAAMLALAFDGSYLVGAALSLALLGRRLGGLVGADLTRLVVRVCVAAIPAAGAAWLTVTAVDRLGVELTRKLDALGALLAGGLVGLGVFLVVAGALHIEEITSIRQTLVRRLRPERQPLP
jgi:putative peptidoglycan lipid II flippase